MEIDIWNGSPLVKGELGEAIVRSNIQVCHKTRELQFEEFFRKTSHDVPQRMKDYLKKYWNSIDFFRFNKRDGKIVNLHIIEVKTKKFCPKLDESMKKFCGLLNITKNTFDALQEAESLGFKAYLAKVTLLFRWRAGLKLIPFRDAKRFLRINNGNWFEGDDYKNIN